MRSKIAELSWLIVVRVEVRGANPVAVSRRFDQPYFDFFKNSKVPCFFVNNNLRCSTVLNRCHLFSLF